MKNIRISGIICGILIMFTMVGCGKEDETEIPEKPERERVEKEADTPETDEVTPTPFELDGDSMEPDTDDRTEPTMTEQEYDLANGLVDNNGSYFVRVGDNVYFRNIPADSLEEGAIFGEFLSTENEPVSSPLIRYDLNTDEWEEVGQIEGTGKLFACPEGFYIGCSDPGNFENYGTQLYDINTGIQEEYCKGIPDGVSKSGEILAVDRFTGQFFKTTMVKDGKDIAAFGAEEEYYEYCGFSGENLVMFLRNEDDTCSVCSADENGNLTILGTIDAVEYGYPEIEQFLTDGDDVYLSIGYYEGTGHFLSAWKAVKATCGVEGSVSVVMDERDETYNEGEVPKLFIDEVGNLSDAKNLPYEVFMGSGNERNNLYYLTDIFDEELIEQDFIKNDYGENCQIVQNITATYDTAFIIYADAEQDADYDIGWRTGYRLTGWHICAFAHFDNNYDHGGKAEKISISDVSR